MSPKDSWERDEPSVVLVTGGSGYIGSSLVPLLAKSHTVRSFDAGHFPGSGQTVLNVEYIHGDIRDRKTIEKALKGVKTIVHLAGIVTDALVDLNQEKARSINNDAMNYLCEAAIRQDVRRFIYASSSSIYGHCAVPATEETEPAPMTAYAETKLKGEEIVTEAFANGELDYCIVRCATCCGPSPRMRLDTILNTFSYQAYYKHEVIVYGGQQWRCNIHIQDAVDFYRLLIDASARKINREIFNLGCENDTALNLATTVIETAYRAGIRPVSLTVDASKSDNRDYRMDSSKVRRTLNWVPRQSLEDAVRDNLYWFMDGNIPDPESDIYWNTRRMAAYMKE